MSKALPREQKKQDVNSGPLLEVTCWGMPCLEKTCITKRIARSLEVHWVVVGIKIACLVSWLRITKIELQLEEVGGVSMKSIEIEFQGQSGIGSCLSRP